MSAVHSASEHALNPFPGLRPFEPEEDYLFFGRERQVDDLMRKLRTTRFLSILGRSGSGKSSLVRSGLIPTLWGGGMTYAGSRWRVVIMRPGEDPIGNLAAALAEQGALMDGKYDVELTRAFFETTLRSSRLGLTECIEQARIPEGNNVLLLVDQFEEIFRYKRSRRVVGRDEATAFVKLLLSMRESELSGYVAITMRSDFIGDCMEFGKLPEVINEGIYLVPRMSRDELKAAITGPVGVGGATITPRLVSRLLNDVGDDPDQLPLLQHALMRTWDRWVADHEGGEGLDLQQYEAVGTLHGALSRHAEEAFAELDERQQIVAEKVFKALTDIGTDARGVRRPAPLSEICAVANASAAEVIEVVETFRMPGRSFLMPPAGVPLHEGSVIDISHESLMRIWDRLRGWADEEARGGQLYLNVARAAQRHEEGVAALWRDPELQLALTWREHEQPTEEWARRYDPSFARAMKFLDASRDERDRDVREHEERRRQKLRAARRMVAVLATASTLTLGLGAYAFVQKGRAEKETIRAEQARRHAVVAQQAAEVQRASAEHQRERAESEQRRAVSEQQRAETERSRASERSAFAETQRQIAEAQRVKAEANEREARTQKTAAELAQQTAVSEKRAADTERQKAVTSETETRRLSRLDAARALALTIPQQKEKDKRETSALLALEAWRLNRDNRGNLQDPDIFTALRSALERLRPLPVLRGEQAAIRALAVSPDGRTTFSGGEDGSVVRFDLNSGKMAEVGRLAGTVRALAVSGNHLAAGGSAGEIRVWDLREPSAAPRALGDGRSAVSALAFAPGAALLAAGRIDGNLNILDVDGGATVQVSVSGSAGRRITALAFSPDGKVLAAGVGKDGALLWNVAAPQGAPRAACAGLDVRSVAFRPDGKGIACGGARGQIVQDDLGARASVTLTAHRSSINALSFDRHGEMLASGSSDGTVRLWESGKSDAQPIVLPGHDSWVWGVAFTPNAERVISGGEDRTVRIWPAKAEVLADELCRAVADSPKKQLSKDEWSKYLPPDLPQERSPCGSNR
jgi:WD40 repeat protein/energy-coupling factor transporter ATP-binding protein EcfA2